jgi:hypothetical protein
LFVIYDRVVRGRPIFVLHVAGRIAGENRLFLRMKNVLDEDIVVEDWQITPFDWPFGRRFLSRNCKGRG